MEMAAVRFRPTEDGLIENDTRYLAERLVSSSASVLAALVILQAKVRRAG
jgi:hypothetical protein